MDQRETEDKQREGGAGQEVEGTAEVKVQLDLIAGLLIGGETRGGAADRHIGTIEEADLRRKGGIKVD